MIPSSDFPSEFGPDSIHQYQEKKSQEEPIKKNSLRGGIEHFANCSEEEFKALLDKIFKGLELFERFVSKKIREQLKERMTYNPDIHSPKLQENPIHVVKKFMEICMSTMLALRHGNVKEIRDIFQSNRNLLMNTNGAALIEVCINNLVKSKDVPRNEEIKELLTLYFMHPHISERDKKAIIAQLEQGGYGEFIKTLTIYPQQTASPEDEDMHHKTQQILLAIQSEEERKEIEKIEGIAISQMETSSRFPYLYLTDFQSFEYEEMFQRQTVPIPKDSPFSGTDLVVYKDSFQGG